MSAFDYDTNAAGLPLLSSRPGLGMTIYLDFDGNGTSLPYDTDGVPGTFNAAEQTDITNYWRGIIGNFAPFDVNVTTDASEFTPGVSTNVAWGLITNSYGNGSGLAWAGPSSTGPSCQVGATSGSGILSHEFGHVFGLAHQSSFNQWGELTAEYSGPIDQRHGKTMGGFSASINKWIQGRTVNGADKPQADVDIIANTIKARVGGDGYLPDEYAADLASATVPPIVNGAYDINGTIERLTDADTFRFDSTGQTFSIIALPIGGLALQPKLELFDAGGTLIASRDDVVQRNGPDSKQELVLTLPAGTYYAKISSHGDYDDQGGYRFLAAPQKAGWTTRDITTDGTGRGGFSTYDAVTDTFVLGASGNDYDATTEDFRYTYRTLDGNGSITARVAAVTQTNDRAKAGVMIRESLAPGSKLFMFDFMPIGSNAIYRTATGGASTGVDFTMLPPNWLRLTRSGTTITAQQSTDGITWTTVRTQTISMTSVVQIGLFVWSQDDTRLVNGTFTNVSVTGNVATVPTTTNGLAAPANLTAAPAATGAATAMQLNWADVSGETGYTVQRSRDGIEWANVGTTAANVTTLTDDPGFGSMRWWYRVSSLSGVTLSAYGASASGVNRPNAVLLPSATMLTTSKISLIWNEVSGETGYRVERSTDGGTTWTLAGTAPANYRTFNDAGLTAFTTYTYRITPTSTLGDGVASTITTSTRIPAVTNLAFTAKASNALSFSWAGIAGVTGYAIQRLNVSANTWSDLTTVAAGVTNYTDTTVLPHGKYHYRVFGTTALTKSENNAPFYTASPPAMAMPAGWADGSVGPVLGTGAGSLANDKWSVLGAGDDVWALDDQLHLTYRTLTGDGSITARLTSFDAIDASFTKVGLMIRESLANNSRYAFNVALSGGGQWFDYRTNPGSNATNSGTGATPAKPVWLRMSRVGTAFTSEWSANGVAWTSLGTRTIVMGPAVLIGLAVSSHDVNRMARANFDGVSVTGNTGAPAPAMTSAGLDFQASQRVRITFDQPISLSTLAASDLTALNLTSGTSAPSPTSVTLSSDGLTATFSYGTSLLNGRYRFTLGKDSLGSTDGIGLAANVVLEGAGYFVLAGDADRDATVNFNDFLALQTNFGMSVLDFSRGDFNYNGVIDFNDFLILQTNFGVTV